MVAIKTPPPKVEDAFTLVQQVQALVESNVRGRDERQKLEDKIFQLNQDVARLEKAMKALIAENDKLKAPKTKPIYGN